MGRNRVALFLSPQQQHTARGQRREAVSLVVRLIPLIGGVNSPHTCSLRLVIPINGIGGNFVQWETVLVGKKEALDLEKIR